MRRVTRTRIMFGSALLLLSNGVAEGEEIRVLAPTTVRPVISALGPQFENTTGHKIVVAYDVAPVVKRQIESGAAFDLAIVTRPLMDDLIKQGRIIAATNFDIARAGAGVAVQMGAAKPDISSVDALKRALLSARSIAYAAEGTTGTYFLNLLVRLGIAAETGPKLKPMGGGAVLAPLVAGEVDFAVATMPLIVEEHRVQLVGAVPSELQNYITFTAGIGSLAKATDPANNLIRLLTAPASVPVIKSSGFEPISR